MQSNMLHSPGSSPGTLARLKRSSERGIPSKLISILKTVVIAELFWISGCSGDPDVPLSPTPDQTPTIAPPTATPTPAVTPTPPDVTPTSKPNQPPVLTVAAPVDGVVVNAGASTSFSLLVTDDQPVASCTVEVFSSLDGSLFSGAPTSGGVVTFAKVLSPGDHVLTFSVTDGEGLADAAVQQLLVNQSPLVTLKQPVDGLLVGNGESVTVVAEAEDPDDAPETLSAVVISSLDGVVASLAVDEFGFIRTSLSTLSPGAQTLEVRVTDPHGGKSSDAVDITVSACEGTDADGDGYGADSACAQVDCNDNDNAIHPGATELCDGKDQDCNGVVDDGLSVTWYKDADGDSYGAASSGTTQSCVQPAGYTSTSSDCNDADVAVHPGATEVCNNKDDNCDGKSDDGQSITYYLDQDKDGYGQAGSTVQSCSPPTGYTSLNGDCNDGNASVNPGQAEVCNSIDDNCDGTVDTGLTATFYRDADGDGYGSASSSIQSCSQPAGYSSVNTDCDDTRADINPGAVEVCNGRDDNCDGKSDDNTSITYYRDADGDAYGVSSSTTQACTQPSGYASRAGDCDDNNASVNPGASEVCNGRDDNCSGASDEGVQTTFYKDADGDGFGNVASGTSLACSAPPGYVSNQDDCNDADATIQPNASERCDGKDNNCDGDVDGEFDQDNDGVTTCATQPDCNDNVPTTFPGATESCDTVDNDCDGTIDDGYDQDKDGFTSCGTPADCNDTQPTINPNASESCNLLDDDCDGTIDEGVGTTYYADTDGDGYGNPSNTKSACTQPNGYVTDKTDCDDTKSAVKPGATETCNSVDDDCDGQKDEGLTTTYYPDADADGYGNTSAPVQACTQPSGTVTVAGDCNDTSASIKPGIAESCNGVDDNCDGKVDNLPGAGIYYKDSDNDGFGNAAGGTTNGCTKPTGYAILNTDCDDSNNNVYPGAADTVGDGTDADCDGRDARPISTNTLTAPESTARINGNAVNDQLGSVAMVGDTNGDGFEDVLVGAPANDAGGSNAGAAYLFLGPITGAMDASTADAEFRGELASDAAGTTVAGAGDVNNDGYDDLLIGAPYFDYNSASNTGCAYLIYGPVSGIVRLTNADVKFPGANANALAGNALSGGDFNGDGYSDIAIGSPGATVLTRSSAGAVYLIKGSNSLLGTYPLQSVTSFYGGAVASSYLGQSLSLRGDYNGDGKKDLLIGSPYFNSSYGGAVYHINGSTAFPNSLDLATGSNYASRFVPESGASTLGNSVDSAGDVDGDGYDDMLIGNEYFTSSNTYQGAIYIVKGGSSYGGITLNTSTALIRVMGQYYYDLFGNSVMGAGDTNGDGYDDIVVGAYGYDTSSSSTLYQGAAYVFLGGPTLNWLATSPELRISGELSGAYFGQRVAAGGDLNADGYPDMMAGAFGADPTSRTDAGSIHIFNGPMLLNVRSSDSRPRFTSPGGADGMGAAMAAAGDVNADGLQDMILGSENYDVDTKANAGAAFLVSGTKTFQAGLQNLTAATARLMGENAGDAAGTSVASAGDVNGDGYDDLLIGAPFYDTTVTDAGAVYLVLGPVTGQVSLSTARAKFTGEKANDNAGNAVAPLGDINKDGYEDFAIGASKYDDGSKKDVGAVYIVYGSATLSGTISLSTSAATLVGELNYDYAGFSVLGPGDVNGDGTADIVVGAKEFDGTGIDSGVVYVVFGPVSGTKNLSTASGKIKGDFAYDYTGSSLAALGDINSDNLADFAVGSPGYDSSSRTGCGAAQIVLGAASFSSVPTIGTAKARIYGDTTGEAFGTSISGGDVNGDGIGDLLVGSPTYDPYATDAGAALLFIMPKGGFSGTYSTASPYAWARYVGNVAADFAGVGVAIIGDASGDGYGDFAYGMSGFDGTTLANRGAAQLVLWRDY